MTSTSSLPETPISKPHRSAAAALLLLFGLSGCAVMGGGGTDPGFGDEAVSVELTDVPFHPDEALYCGPATLAEVLGYTGVAVEPEDLVGGLFIPEREGTLQLEMMAQARRHDRVPYRLDGNAATLLEELHAGNPVIVFQNLGLAIRPVWHYAVLVGYDADAETVVLRSGPDERRLRTTAFFLRSWARGDRWAITVTKPDQPPATAQPVRWLQAAVDLEQTGRLAAAAAAYESGRERWPDAVGFHLGLTNLHYQAGRLEQAEDAARQGLAQSNDDQGVLWNNLAVILADQFRWDEARAAAGEAMTAGGEYSDAFRRTLARINCRGDENCLRQRQTAD
ncbi:tetratricopeptide (TPR) repeat protein [Natronocella acetinitrilica]|uniref:Tetratricopeptide (TPR) repeat protein n=1 Tax=Natronocella acetinitrilica TaxID=414046 RepID=A0AAE3G1D6_9GAMM|nr:PA2778 family cysteine peptidase [Natronocella acetinitrilica]MCP1673749.1 tetratricopeptide (TPR) repeat protein [Natronocella acetinitrilica]